MKKSTHTTLFFIPLIILLLLVSKSNGDSRAQIIKVHCEGDFENIDNFIPNFVRAMGIVSTKLQTSLNATAIVGSGRSKTYALTQCYNDLSIQDCLLCYGRTRNVLPGCYPHCGGRIYLDGCFTRLHNQSFFGDYKGPDDTLVCGNITKTSMLFQEAIRRAAINAATVALVNNDYFAREEMLVPGTNQSVYVLAECWKTLSPDSCRACLNNASVWISKCLPWSEGRVLNTGCFMRYSDTNFLNPIPIASTSGSNTGYYDVEKMAKILNDSSLNFKYSTIEKATGNWDEANKLGQGGFGIVYK
ncbi:hypothetical protein M8C21_017971 [Ambrosia artemisiifolia]|uniref:Gnk2-homologous domain-containing protein n=1 Tax=Ambrosia artemisiifolia TaxID=4212 RepID=A0AAD5G5S7_AMBAR|nr:hypothetical protein M8C21_017971 [Ambrosia artemisiifolia]